MSALSGITILDLTRVLAGPFCTQLLADFGANVIKIEKPGIGDDTRLWGPPYLKDKNGNETKESGYYISINRNKKSIALDITSKEGIDSIHQLVKQSDIFIENFKVGGLKKYNLDYQSIAKIKPDIIYCSISGFGQTGPNAHKMGYDLIAQAFSGLMSINGSVNSEPTKVGASIADVISGLYASSAILAALHHKNKNGEGQYIDIALADCQIPPLVHVASNYLLSKKLPKRYGNQHPNIVPYQLFQTKDSYIIIAVGNDSQFEALCKILEKPELSNNPKYKTNSSRVKNQNTLLPIISKSIKNFEANHLLNILEKNNVPSGMVNNLQQLFESDQVAAREMVVSMPAPHLERGNIKLVGNPIKFSKTPVSYKYIPPSCGEHNQISLKELLSK